MTVLDRTTGLSATHHLAALVDSSHDAIISKTLDGTILSWNPAAERIFGYSAQEIVGRSILTLFPPEHHHEEAVILGKLKKGERIEHYETVRRRKDGSLIDVSITVSPIMDDHGKVVGGSKIARDVTERRRADAIAYHFAAIVESSQDAIVSKNVDGVIQSWNGAAERIFGYRADEVVGQSVLVLIPEDRRHEEAAILKRIHAGERVEHFETIRRHKNGSPIHVSLTISPVKNARGDVIGASKIARDIREQKRSEAAKELLLHEIKHRVKNTLGTVQALVAQTFKSAPQAEHVAFGARLQAHSRAHDLLTQRNWQGASLGEVVERALSPFRNKDERLRVTGQLIELAPSKALLVAMLLHELATNATKYGALSNDTGHVDLTWDEDDGEGGSYVKFRWRESGGPKVSPPIRTGFGTRMIERSLKAEGGSAQLDYDPAGLVCSVTVPLTTQ